MKVIVKNPLKKINFKEKVKLRRKHFIFFGISFFVLVVTVLSTIYIINSYKKSSDSLLKANGMLSNEISSLNSELTTLKNEDTRKTNEELNSKMKMIAESYKNNVSIFEKLNDLKLISKNTSSIDTLYAKAVNFLSSGDLENAGKTFSEVEKAINTENEKNIAKTLVSASAPVNNTPPGSGYSRQSVQTESASFTVSLIAADLGSTKVIVDTASDADCNDNCPVLPLSTYVSRNGAYAGINGSYFCPASYPSCSGKTNSFDLLVMNKNKHYFNSANNVYSSNPAVIFGGSYIRFVSSASQWGRDTGIDGMLSNYPLLVEGGTIRFSGNSDPKMSSRGMRGFVANKGNTVYIGFVHNATMSESAIVLKTLGMENAMNLDEGGSTALWSGGYKLGPGRDIPNAILFVRK